MIFIINGFQTIVFIFIVISTTFRPICPPGLLQVFIMTMVIVISFVSEHKTVPNGYAPELLTRIVQSPTKLNDKI